MTLNMRTYKQKKAVGSHAALQILTGNFQRDSNLKRR